MGKIDDALKKVTPPQREKSAEPTFSGYGFPIVDFTDPNSPLVESYRTLRTNIQRSSRSKSIRSILITSAARGEGRTQTATNLAVLLSAIEGNKTLLIDADLRHPTLHDIFEMDKGPGLSEVLHGAAAVGDVIHPTRIGNLKMIPSGHTLEGSAELFHSPRLSEAIETLKSQYDFLIFDSPPTIPYTDSSILAGYVDGLILVVRARETRREVVHRAKDLLNQSEDKFMGVVLNSVEYVIPRPIYEKL